MMCRSTFLLAAGLVLAISTKDAAACSCFNASLSQNYAYADAVLTGAVTRVDTVASQLIATIATDEVFKGEIGATVEVRTHVSSATCGYPGFQVGRTLLLFASESDAGWLQTGLCHGNVAGEAVSDVVERLRSLPETSGYLPVHAGDTWTFALPPADSLAFLTVGIEAVTTSDERTYFRVSGTPFPTDSLYVDAFGNLGGRMDGQDVLLFDFTADERYMTSILGQGFMVTVEREQTVFVSPGRFENCIRFTFETGESVAWSFTLAPNLGIILVTGSNGARYELASAEIDGKVVTSPIDVPRIPEDGLHGTIHPNPTHTHATVSVHLPATAHVRVSVHDALGREVAVLGAGTRGPGDATWEWPSDGLSAGLYFIHVVAGEKRLVFSAVRL